MKPITITELQDITGYSRDQLLRMAKKGIVVRVDRGKYDLAETVQNIISNLQEMGHPKEADAKKRYDAAKAEKIELEVRMMKAELINIEDAMIAWGKIIENFRANILSIPTAIAPDLTDCEEIGESEAIIKSAVYEALTELSNPDLVDVVLNLQKEKRKRNQSRR